MKNFPLPIFYIFKQKLHEVFTKCQGFLHMLHAPSDTQ